MATSFDPRDVPTIAAEDLAPVMRRLIAANRGLVFLRGLADEDVAIVERTLNERLGKDPARELAALMRFRALVEIFAIRRLRDMVLERGFETIAPAIQAAARLRLDASQGFDPHTFTRAMWALIDADPIATHVVAQELLTAA